MKKQTVVGYVIPISTFILGSLLNIYSSEIKIKLNNMNLPQFLSSLLFVISGISIAYSFYLKTSEKIELLIEYSNLQRANADQTDKYYNSLMESYSISLCEELKKMGINIEPPKHFETMTTKEENLHRELENNRLQRMNEIYFEITKKKFIE